MRFVPLGGFLGAGKTTTMLAAGLRLEQRGETVSVVTNDQGVDLVDTALAKAAALGEVAEVTGGCFCCRFDDLAYVVTRLKDDVHPGVVLAEAVGSCTDLQSTVVRPLRHFYGDELQVAPLTVLVDPARYAEISQSWQQLDTEPDLAYLYRHQLDEADIIAVNKTDLLTAEETNHVRTEIQARFPHAHVVTYSAHTEQGLDALLALWTGPAITLNGDREPHTPFAVDYQRYGAAEAELAWTNQTLRLHTVEDHTFTPADWAEQFLHAFSDATAREDIPVGHVKLRVSTADGTTKASLTGAGTVPTYDEQHWTPARSAELVLNARVQTSPGDLDALIGRCVAIADTAVGATSSDRRGAIFRPGFPVPVHRM